MKTKLITCLAFMTTSIALAGVWGNQPKHFASDNLQIALTPLAPGFADGGGAYSTTVDGTDVSVANDVLSNKLGSLSDQLSKYQDAKNCAFNSLSLGKFSTSGTLTASKGKDWTGATVKFVSADLSNSADIAAKLKLPANWKSLCKK